MQMKKKHILNLFILATLTFSMMFYSVSVVAVPIGEQISNPVVTNEPSSQPVLPDPASSQVPPASSNTSEAFNPFESEPVSQEPPLSSDPVVSENPGESSEEIPSENPDSSSEEEPSSKPSSSSRPNYENNNRPSNSQRPDEPDNTPSRPGVTSAPNTVASAPADSRPVTSFANGDLDDLLTMSEPSSDMDSSLSSETDINGGIFQDNSNNASGVSDGGPSGLLLGGIALILLALCGIGFVVYQYLFVMKRPPNRREFTSAPPTSRKSGLTVNKTIPPIPPPTKASSNVYQDGYYDDPNDDPYSDYYDDIDYGTSSSHTVSSQEYTDISGASPSETFTDISKDSSTALPQEPKKKSPIAEDDFDWDSFFNNNKK